MGLSTLPSVHGSSSVVAQLDCVLPIHFNPPPPNATEREPPPRSLQTTRSQPEPTNLNQFRPVVRAVTQGSRLEVTQGSRPEGSRFKAPHGGWGRRRRFRLCGVWSAPWGSQASAPPFWGFGALPRWWSCWCGCVLRFPPFLASGCGGGAVCRPHCGPCPSFRLGVSTRGGLQRGHGGSRRGWW